MKRRKHLAIETLDDRSVPAFLTPVDYSVGWYPSEVKAGDFNGDDIPDLATLDSGSNSISMLLGNGDGTFQQTASSYAGDGAPLSSLAVGDFNDDGTLDLATGANHYDLYQYGVDDVVVLIGNGDGTFAAPVYLGTGLPASGVATGDLNGDEQLDLVVTAWDNDAQQGSLSVMLGHGDGSFSPATTYIPYPYFLPLPVVADFDGDTNADVAVGSEVFLSNGDGTLQDPIDIGPDVYWSQTAADFNGDGNLDLAGTNGTVNVLLGNGDGTFQPAQSFASAWSTGALNAADVNGDQVLDLVWVAAPYITAILGNGDGSFGLPISVAYDHYPSAFVVADLNADGLADAAVASSDQSIPNSMTGTLSVLANDGVWPPEDPPVVRIRAFDATEYNTSPLFASFTVSLSHTSTADVTIHYVTADITATAGSDYSSVSGDIVIPAGETIAHVAIPVHDDRLGEPTETFAINLTHATGATIDGGQAIAAIFDNEPRITISDVAKAEGRKGRSTLFSFTVTLSAAYDQPVSVSFQTRNGTATTANSDYVAKSGTLTFAPGETTKTITIEVKGDNKREADESFFVDLTGIGTNMWFTKGRGVGTIWNDD